MIPLLLKILIIYALVGAILILFIGNRKPSKKKQMWTKYTVYMLLITLVMSSILIGTGYFLGLAILISLIGSIEIIKVGITSKQLYITILLALITFGIIAIFFIYMANVASTTYLISIYFFVVVFDAFSQLSGQLLGKRTITTISPNKTWEGLVGGLLTTISSIFLLHWVAEPEWPFTVNPIVLGLSLSTACFLGDLLASWYKRICNVKDYSKILPGQGGILDRYDSLITTGIVFYLTNLFYA